MSKSQSREPFDVTQGLEKVERSLDVARGHEFIEGRGRRDTHICGVRLELGEWVPGKNFLRLPSGQALWHLFSGVNFRMGFLKPAFNLDLEISNRSKEILSFLL